MLYVVIQAPKQNILQGTACYASPCHELVVQKWWLPPIVDALRADMVNIEHRSNVWSNEQCRDCIVKRSLPNPQHASWKDKPQNHM